MGDVLFYARRYDDAIAIYEETIAVDPDHRLNAGIADIDLAPRNEDGRVEATMDVAILRPVDLAKYPRSTYSLFFLFPAV